MTLIKKYNQVENKTVGIFKDGNSFLALTLSASKEFKTINGAKKWIEKRI